MWDCGTQQILEQTKYRYVFRTQANATPEVLATMVREQLSVFAKSLRDAGIQPE